MTYFAAALQQLTPEIDPVIQDLLQTSPLPPPETMMTTLINQIAASTPKSQSILVLDDYHLIGAKPIHSLLTFLLDHLPPQLHLVILTRIDPPLPLARLRARGQLTELREADLRFTFDETATFFNHVMRLNLDTEDVATLDARTEGWVAGLQLAALSIQGRVTERVVDFIAAFSGSHQHVIDYLAEEVMARQTEEIRDFLRQTSILNRLSASLCNAVTGRKDSDAILKQLEHANLFLIPLDDQQQWYRYHRLFADFLRSRLYQVEGQKEEAIAELHRRASAWYEQEGLTSAAIEHVLRAKDFERAVHLVENVAEAILMRSEVATLQNWVDALPNDLVRARPLLCVYHAWALALGGSPFETALSRLQDAMAADADGATSGEVTAFRAWVAAIQGDIAQTIELSQQALNLLPDESLFIRGIVTGSLGLVHTWNGNIGPALQAFTEAARIGQQTGNLIITVLALVRLSQLTLMQGQLHRSKTFIDQALVLAVDGQNQPRPIAGMAFIGLGWLFLAWNDLERAQHNLIAGVELASKWSEIGSFQGHIGLALVKQAQGDPDGANEAMQTARQLAVNFDAVEIDDIVVAAYQAYVWILQGNTGAALRWVEERELALSKVERLAKKVNGDETDQKTDKTSTPLVAALEYITLARLHLAQNQPADALAVLKPLLQKAEAADWIWYVIEILLLQAVAYREQGNTSQALQSLERALALAEPGDFVRVFLDAGPSMNKLLQQAAAQGIAVDYVGKLLDAFSKDEGGRMKDESKMNLHPSSFISQPLFEPLSEREIEVLRLIAAGLSNREIAAEIVVAVSTVKTHINNIYRKLDVSSRTRAVAKARELKLV
jgi:LuxR family maltose regulon positive regulatory protein